MKKTLSLFCTLLILLSFPVYAHAEFVVIMPEVTLPQEPSVKSNDIAYLAYAISTSSQSLSGLTPSQARQRYGLKGGGGVLSLVDDNGGTVVFSGSGYGGSVGFVFEDLGGPVMMTAVDPKTGIDYTSKLPPRIEPGFANLIDDSRMNGKWYWKTQNTSSPTVVFEGEYIFDSITLFRSSNNKTELGVAKGGTLVIGKNTKFEKMSTVQNNVSASVDEGGVLFLHTSGLSSYSGKGIIVADRALFDNGKLTKDDFESFKGVVMYENGEIIVDHRDTAPYTYLKPDNEIITQYITQIETVYVPQIETVLERVYIESDSAIEDIRMWIGIASVSALTVTFVILFILKKGSSRK